MNRLLLVLVLLLAGVAGLGFYRGWFSFSKDSTDHKTNMTLSVDRDKIQDDKETARERAQEFGSKVKEKVGAATDRSKCE
jgi:hypothetical protein